MKVPCGMCGEGVKLRYEASESEEMPSSTTCGACQDYVMGFIYPEPVNAHQGDEHACSEYERWKKQRSTNVKAERRQYDRS